MIATDSSIYELTAAAYLSIKSIDLDRFLEEAGDDVVLSILAALSSAAKLLSIDRNRFWSER